MDKTLFYVSLFLMTIGIVGQLSWYFFGHIPCNPPGGNPYLLGAACDPHATAASFQEMQNISGYATIIGLILLPAGLFKDGLPSPGRGARILIGILLIMTITVASTGALLTPTSTSKGPSVTPEAYISILSGSAVPGTLITFSPQNVTVIIGYNNTVEWTNNDTAAHTVTSSPGDPASFNSGIMVPGETFVYTFMTPGTYNYICTIHNWMHGTVVVKS
ncbi:MAG: cupredoxin domain-containing protein [Nitrososphaerota archaeon]|nr:cupredoxin domain-containing protein [Nitrososphaerota archaeon]MDG6923745.1 cupredoxin domain-containing protein [Nitrososphaerota archaeon]